MTAGYVPDTTLSFTRKIFGCYMGNVNVDYLKSEMDVYYSPGTMRAFLSGRISYACKFSAPSVTLDTACSGSMIAILQACRALAAGDCRVAVAGGVNIMTNPDISLLVVDLILQPNWETFSSIFRCILVWTEALS